MHTGLKRIKLHMLAFLLMLGASFAYADSTAVSALSNTSSPTVASAAPSQVFVLETGLYDFDTSNATNKFCTTNLCPAGFNPYLTFAPYKIATQGTDYHLCPVNPPVTGGGCTGYNETGWHVSVNSNGTVSSGTSNIAFQWTLYCYPQSITPPTDATCSPASTANYTPAVIPIDAGYYDWQTLGAGRIGNNYSGIDTNNISSTFLTNANQICPTGYHPHAILSPNKMAMQNYDLKVCLTGAPTLSGSQYKVPFQVTALSKNFNMNTTGMSFSWQIYCSPPGSAATDGADSTCSSQNYTQYEQQPMYLGSMTFDSVQLNYYSTVILAQNVFTKTFYNCPKGYSPYATSAVTKANYSGGLVKIMSCTSGLWEQWFPSYTFWGIFPVANFQALVWEGYVGVAGAGNFDQSWGTAPTVGITINMYCYPPTAPVPAYDSNCPGGGAASVQGNAASSYFQ